MYIFFVGDDICPGCSHVLYDLILGLFESGVERLETSRSLYYGTDSQTITLRVYFTVPITEQSTHYRRDGSAVQIYIIGLIKLDFFSTPDRSQLHSVYISDLPTSPCIDTSIGGCIPG